MPGGPGIPRSCGARPLPQPPAAPPRSPRPHQLAAIDTRRAAAHASPRSPGTVTGGGPQPHRALPPPAPAAAGHDPHPAPPPPPHPPAAPRAVQLPSCQLPLDHAPITIYREHDASARHSAASPRGLRQRQRGEAAPHPTPLTVPALPPHGNPDTPPVGKAPPPTKDRQPPALCAATGIPDAATP